MPDHVDPNVIEAGEPNKAAESQKPSPPAHKHWFTTPAPIKRLFDKFPLRAYSPNELPLQRHAVRAANTLYVFAIEEEAKVGRPSFNPSCLKWQVCSLSFDLLYPTERCLCI